MIREWLLVIWLGTSTNFTIQGTYWNVEDCARARQQLTEQLAAEFVVICTQNMREGRSAYATRPGSSGIVK